MRIDTAALLLFLSGAQIVFGYEYCPSGFDPLSTGWCYVSLKRGSFNFAHAAETCQSMGDSFLPVLPTSELNEALLGIRNEMFGASRLIWIGLNCSADGTWSWLDGTPYDESQSHFSDSNDNFYCPEGYTHYSLGDDGDWCFILNDPLPPGNRIDFVTAQSTCEQRDGETLPIVSSESINNVLVQMRKLYADGQGAIWIGVVCNAKTQYWQWEDGSPLVYSNFQQRPSNPCDNHVHYAQTKDGIWNSFDLSSSMNYYMCARRALPASVYPPLPTPPMSHGCPLNMYALTGWCYAFGLASHSGLDYEQAKSYCEQNYHNGYLPSISTIQENDDIMYLRRYFLGSDEELLWIGLSCNDSGQWYWENGERWKNFDEFADHFRDPFKCDPSKDDVGFLFDSLGKWEAGRANKAKYIVCSRAPSDTPTRKPPTTPTQVPDRCPLKYHELVPGKCIKWIGSDMMTFDHARTECTNSGGELPSIGTSLENYQYKEIAASRIGPFWIGLTCISGLWRWTDATPLVFTNFADSTYDPVTCIEEENVVFTLNQSGKWVASNRTHDVNAGICARRADESVPTPPTAICAAGWKSIDGLCYSVNDIGRSKRNMTSAQEICKGMDANLPTILSRDQNERLYMAMRDRFLGNFSSIQFWIGLSCTENGDFAWLDDSPYAYNNIPQLFASDCSSSSIGFGFAADSSWLPHDSSSAVDVNIVCSKPGLAPTTSQPPSTTEEPTTATTVTTTATTSVPTTTLTTTVKHVDPQPPTTTQLTPTTTTVAVLTTHTTTIAPEQIPPFPVWAIVLLALGAFLLVLIGCSLLVLLGRRRIASLQAEIVEIEIERNESKTAFDVNSTKPRSRYYSYFPSRTEEWEIERKYVAIDYTTKLGEGAFGSVFLGRVLAKNVPVAGKSIIELKALKNDNDLTAVKMLHENADAYAERDFRAEIDIMQKIGYHERLVNILACVTSSDPVLLITEYCSNGDLLDFMRHRKIYMMENPQSLDTSKFITIKNQIMFAIQVAYGLEYLSTRGFIHRDIAARNILVDHHETCKIADFGLCRTVGKEEEHYHSQGGKLPLKWMPPEAIDKFDFSVASDVWSYGVLLFEIITLGATPYSGWPAVELLPRLLKGDRIERPDNCSDDIYELMTKCWAGEPSNRPSFTKLRKRLGALLEDINQDNYYLKLNTHSNYYVLPDSHCRL